MNEFIERYAVAFELFEKYGFENPILHRRRENPNAEKILILLTDKYTDETQPKPLTERLWNLKTELMLFSQRDILLLTDEDLTEKTISELKRPGAAALLLTKDFAQEEKKEELKRELVRVLGAEWVGLKVVLTKKNSQLKFGLTATAPAIPSKTASSSLDDTVRFLSELPESEYSEVLRKTQEMRAQQASRQTLISSK